MNTSHRANEEMQAGVSPFHCCYEYEYHQKKDQLQNGVDRIESAIEMAEEDGIEDERLEDMKTVLEIAREVADGDRSLRDGQAVKDIYSFGLSWALIEPEEFPGYAPEIDTDKWNLEANTL